MLLLDESVKICLEMKFEAVFFPFFSNEKQGIKIFDMM